MTINSISLATRYSKHRGITWYGSPGHMSGFPRCWGTEIGMAHMEDNLAEYVK